MPRSDGADSAAQRLLPRYVHLFFEDDLRKCFFFLRSERDQSGVDESVRSRVLVLAMRRIAQPVKTAFEPVGIRDL
eukprot:5158514-Prymnesium_polylepis.1